MVIPVTDIDRAKSFHVDKLGFHLDADMRPTETIRVVQMNLPCRRPPTLSGPISWRPTPSGAGVRASSLWFRKSRRHTRSSSIGYRGFGAPESGSSGRKQVRFLQRSEWQQLGRAGDPQPRRCDVRVAAGQTQERVAVLVSWVRSAGRVRRRLIRPVGSVRQVGLDQVGWHRLVAVRGSGEDSASVRDRA